VSQSVGAGVCMADDNIRRAIELQRQWAYLVEQRPLMRAPVLVGGLDVAFGRKGQRCVAAAVVLSYPSLELQEQVWAEEPVRFPYIPGLLSFREAPVMMAAVKKLSHRPDVLLVDGQGLAHPRRFGLACHLGVKLGAATIGCAKSRLTGKYREPGRRKGRHCQLTDGGEVVGAVVRTRTDVKSLYVSVGHRVELEQAVRLVLGCCQRYRLPEPTRQAHQLVSRLRLSLGMDKAGRFE